MEKIPFVLIDESVLTNGMRVLVDGIDLSQFEKNPVMFYYHDRKSLPVGRWENIRKENGQVMADADFDEDDDDPDVRRMIKKVKNGYIKMASAGLVDLELSDEDAYRVPAQSGYTVIRSRMREASIVPLGGNHNALSFRLYDNEGNEINAANEADQLKLSDFIINKKPKEKMIRKYLTMLNLGDDASDMMIEAAVQQLHADKEAAELSLADINEKLRVANERLAGIELADKQRAMSAFTAELDQAFLDGRLSEKPEGDKPTPVRDRMLNLFDASGESAFEILKALPKRQPVTLDLADDLGIGGAFAARQKEIDEQNKGK